MATLLVAPGLLLLVVIGMCNGPPVASDSDRKLARTLLGTWQTEGYTRDAGYTRVLRFYSDATVRFEGQGRVPMANGIVMTVNVPAQDGRWSIVDSDLVVTMEGSLALPSHLRGQPVRTPIRFLDTSTLRFGSSSWPAVSGRTFRRVR